MTEHQHHHHRHHPQGHAPAPVAISPSILRLSVFQRLAFAAILTVIVWVAVIGTMR